MLLQLKCLKFCRSFINMYILDVFICILSVLLLLGFGIYEICVTLAITLIINELKSLVITEISSCIDKCPIPFSILLLQFPCIMLLGTQSSHAIYQLSLTINVIQSASSMCQFGFQRFGNWGCLKIHTLH